MRTTSQPLVVLAITVLVLVLAGCGGGSPAAGPRSGPPTPAPSVLSQPAPSSEPTQSPTPTPVSTPGASISLASVGWVSGFKVAVNGATVSADGSSLQINALVTNTSQRDWQLNAISDELLLDPGDQSGLIHVSKIVPGNDVIAGSTARGSLTFEVPPGFTLDKAVLVLGAPANHQWLVPLQTGARPTGELPVTLRPPAGTLRTPTGVYYRITSAQLLPWSCASVAPHTGFIPITKDTSVIAVNGTAGASGLPRNVHADAIGSMSITAPDGTTAAVTTPPLRSWSNNDSTSNELLCLPVPAHLPGTYTITITDYEHKTATANVTVP